MPDRDPTIGVDQVTRSERRRARTGRVERVTLSDGRVLHLRDLRREPDSGVWTALQVTPNGAPVRGADTTITLLTDEQIVSREETDQ